MDMVQCVLILVLLEDGIGAIEQVTELANELGLNPCFIGRWYRRNDWKVYQKAIDVS